VGIERRRMPVVVVALVAFALERGFARLLSCVALVCSVAYVLAWLLAGDCVVVCGSVVACRWLLLVTCGDSNIGGFVGGCELGGKKRKSFIQERPRRRRAN